MLEKNGETIGSTVKSLERSLRDVTAESSSHNLISSYFILAPTFSSCFSTEQTIIYHVVNSSRGFHMVKEGERERGRRSSREGTSRQRTEGASTRELKRAKEGREENAEVKKEIVERESLSSSSSSLIFQGWPWDTTQLRAWRIRPWHKGDI